MKPYCTQNHGVCEGCSLSSYGKDCVNNPIDDPIDPADFTPTRYWVEELMVGDPAPDCFGRMAEVVKIIYRGQDVHGNFYVGVRLAFGDRSTITESYKQGRVHICVK